MDQYFIDKMRAKLIKIQAEQRGLIDSLETGFDRSLTESVGELSSIDQHTSDLGNETLEREKDLGLLAQAEHTWAQCSDAFERMDQGVYGTCEVCGQQIGEERLEALPFAAKCITCQAADDEDRTFWRPAEEAVLSPPFSAKVKYGEEGIDRDDAWEIVARHGTSNAPQDTPEEFDDDDDLTEKGNG